MIKQIINPDNVHRPRGYSHAYRVGNTIYISGQTALDEEGNLVGPGDIVAQSRQAYENMKRILEAAGATMRDIVKLNYFCKDLREIPKAAGVYREYFGDHYPANTAVQISNLWEPGFLLEVEAVAVVE